MEHLTVPSGHFLPASRLEAFSDGVFAIAITLLILNLHVPDSPDRLVSDLAAEWPSFLGYLVSFSFIGGSWLAHTALTHLLPFSTSLLTKHLSGAAEHVAVVIFGINLTLGTLVSSVMISYVARTDELKSNVDPAKVAWLERQRWTTATLFALSTALSAFFPKLAVGFYLMFSLLLIAQPLWRLPQRVLAHRRRARSGDGAG